MDRRLDLKLGFACNNNCRFCAAGHKRNAGNKTTKTIKLELDEARTEGLEEVVLTGGEPTIRPDIFEIVSYASKIGYTLIQIQTNGRMFSYRKFCEKMIDAGANNFSLSIHGPRADIHDFLTQSPGSFEQTLQGIKNVVELGQTDLSNSVVTKSNYTHLPELAHMLVDLGVSQIQMAFVHAVGNADKDFDYIVPRKSLAAPYIRKALQIGLDAGIKVMAEDMPYCFMRGYEKYLGELYCPPTEIRDINYIDPKFEETKVKEGKCKGEKCKSCKYYLVCEGPWREYPERRGWGEFIPMEDNSKSSVATPPSESEELILEKAYESFMSGDILQSFIYDKKVLDKYPCNETALYNVAELADFKFFNGKESDFEEFMMLCSNALRLEPNNPAAFDLMARIYKIRGNYKKAIEYYSKECAVSANWRAWTALGIAYRNNGDIQIGNNIIFNFRLYSKLFSGDWKDVYDYRLRDILTVVNTPNDLNKILNAEPRFKVLSFRIENKLLNRKTGEKIIKFLDKQRSKNILLRISRPLPKCLFSASEYQKLLELYDIPKNCLECLELVLVRDGHIELCDGGIMKLGEKIIKDEVYSTLKKTSHKSLNPKCRKCIHSLRRNCELLCFNSSRGV